MPTVIRSTAGAVLVALVVTAAPAPAAPGAPPEPVLVNVVAHEDDDILFMNPDLHNSIRSGRPAKTVFLTAGESGYAPEHGKDTEPTAPVCRDRAQLDRERYARCRQLGARAAYARMAGVADEWNQEAVLLAGHWVERHSLTARPDIELVFLNIPDWADRHEDVNGTVESLKGASLHHLWANERPAGTITPTGGALAPEQRTTYRDGQQVVDVLTALFHRFRPTVIRVQDAEPDTRYRYNPSWGHDHSDHIAGARLAAKAATAYPGPDGRAVTRLVPYRNYNTNDVQVNLDAGQRAGKTAFFDEYARFDAEVDRPLSGDYAGWTQRMRYRYATGSTWAGRNADGRLQAFAVQGRGLVTWWQQPGGEFAPPAVLPAPGPLAPGVSVTTNHDGRLQLFARRLDTNEFVTTWQTTANGGFSTTWASLGNPNAGSPGAAQAGTPIATRTADGRIRVFVKNGGGGVSTVSQTAPNAGFSPSWTDLGGGPGVEDGLAVGNDAQGGTSLFAYAVENGVGRVKHWTAPRPDQGTQRFTLRPNLDGLEPAGPPTVATSGNGRLQVFFRLATNQNGDHAGRVGRAQQLPDGSWGRATENLGGHGGVDGVAATTSTAADPRILLFTTNRGGGLSTTGQVGVDQGFRPEWTDLGGVVIGQPSAVVDADGVVFVFALTDSGALVVRNQVAAGGGNPLSRERVLETP